MLMQYSRWGCTREKYRVFIALGERKFFDWFRMKMDLAILLHRKSVLSLKVRFLSSRMPSSLKDLSFLLGCLV